MSNFDYLKCPFCPNHNIEAISGKNTCPECLAEFEIDDRLECIFINPNKLRLPMAVNGTVCGVCGLVQGDEVARCGYCGVELETNSHKPNQLIEPSRSSTMRIKIYD